MRNNSNLIIVDDTKFGKIIDRLREERINALQGTNGIYNPPAHVLTGTTLAGFQFMEDTVATPHFNRAFFIAVNTDDSAKRNSKDLVIEPQRERALKVAVPTAIQFPETPIIIMFYEEDTPTPLYEELDYSGAVNLSTIFKWGGYGIGHGPKIEGATLFDHAHAHPFYNDDLPASWDVTKIAEQAANTRVMNLHKTKGPHGDVYLTPDNQPLFELN